MVGVCHTAAAAIKSGEAVTAFLLGVYIAAPELIRNLRLCNAIVYISHQEVLIPYKLVTWIEIPDGVTARYSVPDPHRKDVWQYKDLLPDRS